MSHLPVGRGTGPLEALTFENAEPELDLVEPRRMERQEGQAHAARLRADPGGDGRVRMNGEVVRDDDNQTPSRAPLAACSGLYRCHAIGRSQESIIQSWMISGLLGSVVFQ
jgi:hypothetical protein